jgi:high-affinity Fe2+/Pb2+ permease
LAKIRQKLKLGNMETLETPQLRLASDYYNDEELAAFKKPKTKKKKIRKKMLKVCTGTIQLDFLCTGILILHFWAYRGLESGTGT